MLRDIEYFARSLKVTQSQSGVSPIYTVFRCNYVCVVPFLRYSALNNGVTLKSWLGIVQRH